MENIKKVIRLIEKITKKKVILESASSGCIELIQHPYSLEIKLLDTAEVLEIEEQSHGEIDFLSRLLEESGYIGNDWYVVENPGLTEVPAIGYGANYSDETGEIVDYDEIYYFDRYQVESFFEKLIEEGSVHFTKYQ